MRFDLVGGFRLLLAGGGRAWTWVALGLLAAALLAALYRAERRLVSRRAGLALLALRLLAAAALVGALLEPIAARTVREAVRGRVVVAVDASESMSTADPGRDPAVAARLAGALGLPPSERPDALSRREVARRLLSGPLARLADDHDVAALAFAREAAPAAGLDALAGSLRTPGRPDDPAALATDWAPALAAALDQAGPVPVLGVVLLSDGRRNAPGDPAGLVDRLAARKIPVYPVLVGSEAPPRDAAVASLRLPESVYAGDAATVEATLKLDGLPAGSEVGVVLERPGAEPIRKAVAVPVDGSRPTVAFRVVLDQPGPAPLSVAVEAPEGDARPDNDRRSAVVQVADDRARVLLVDGEARWEFRYLRNALARDPRAEVDAVVFRQPAPGSADPTYRLALPPRPADPAEPDPLGAFDAIVVGDVDPADLGSEGLARLEAYAAERGGTLILSAGPRWWAAWAADPRARALLPVLDPAPLPARPSGPDPDRPALPPGAGVVPAPAALADPAAWPMLQLAAEPEGARAAWAGLPRLPWALAGRPKPGASALVVPADLAPGEEAAVIAAQPFGLGKVLWVGTDGTWRWRFRVGDAYHHRFWGQAVRWAASGRLAAGNRLVRFGPARPRAAGGEPVAIRARFAEGLAGVGPGQLVAARIHKAGEPESASATAVVPLRASPGRPGVFEAEAPGLPAGSYVVRLDAPGLADRLAEAGPLGEAALEVVDRETPERVELAADRSELEALAAATGGRLVLDADAATLPPLLRARTVVAERTEETPLWDNPAALILFFGLLAAEWTLRKRLGLP